MNAKITTYIEKPNTKKGRQIRFADVKEIKEHKKSIEEYISEATEASK